MVELGLGLLSIGRPWGVRQEPPPSEDAALHLLQSAVDLGIRFFDTAPAYGASEAILGRFLRTNRREVFIATKMGETWQGASVVDHRYESLQRSIDRSVELLGRIDLLQLHKATADNLRSPDVGRAVEYARSRGIREFGASVPDVAAAEVAASSGWCTWLQFPYNRANTALEPIFRLTGMKLIVNRPLAMGALGTEAFQFIRRRQFAGVVLTGTKSARHLAENYAAFHAAGNSSGR